MTKPMQIAHEAPISLMPLVRELTDYDYCLVHLCDQDPNYVKYFLESREMGRKIIMDCSVYELGHSYNWERYAYWINSIRPDEYIVPDVFMKYEANLQEFEQWMKKEGDLIGHNFPEMKAIGVIQGNTLEEFEKSYRWMSEYADKIAISFGYGYFWDEYLNNNYVNEYIEYGLSAIKTKFKPQAYYQGRRNLLKHFIEQGIINYNKPHHLLGCGLPDEFRLYADEDQYSFIGSIDTTHPVMTAMMGERYPFNMNVKSDKKMVDLYDQHFNDEVITSVIHNVNYFREEICGYSRK